MERCGLRSLEHPVVGAQAHHFEFGYEVHVRLFFHEIENRRLVYFPSKITRRNKLNAQGVKKCVIAFFNSCR